MYRQGDVLLVPVAEIPRTGRTIATKVLAYGEATGHKHAVREAENAEVYDVGEKKFLRVIGDSVSIVHEEHGTLTAPKGNYEVRIQIEEGPDEILRQVRD